MEFHYPRTVKETSALLRKLSSLAVAGGTSFATKPRVKHLVDLTGLGLNYIKDRKTEIVIGATATITDLMEFRPLAHLASGILHAASSTTADTQLRNVITVGGNIACGYAWANLPPALIVLDARLGIVGRRERVIPIEQFFKSRLQSGEFISEIIVPKKSNKGKGAFVKFSRTSSDYSLATVAVYGERQGEKASVVRAAVSGITHPTRMKAIESELQNKVVAEELLERTITKTVARLPIMKSYIFGEEYRRGLLGTLLRRTFVKVLMGG